MTSRRKGSCHENDEQISGRGNRSVVGRGPGPLVLQREHPRRATHDECTRPDRAAAANGVAIIHAVLSHAQVAAGTVGRCHGVVLPVGTPATNLTTVTASRGTSPTAAFVIAGPAATAAITDARNAIRGTIAPAARWSRHIRGAGRPPIHVDADAIIRGNAIIWAHLASGTYASNAVRITIALATR
jgi:hypothetical protein